MPFIFLLWNEFLDLKLAEKIALLSPQLYFERVTWETFVLSDSVPKWNGFCFSYCVQQFSCTCFQWCTSPSRNTERGLESNECMIISQSNVILFTEVGTIG